MNRQELRTSIAVGLLYLIRMMGLFMVIPVLPLASDDFKLSTTLLLGFAIGIHGLTQSLFQIPFGMLSDRVGRKKIIALGLVLFIIGSSVAALAENVYWLIIGRALQGCGAIASTLLALMSDLTRLEQRTKSMALIGAAIASSFGLALLVGPILFNQYGAKSIFSFSAVSGLIGLWILFTIIPSPQSLSQNLDLKFQFSDAKRAVSSLSLWRLNISTFILHYLLISGFCAFPLLFDSTNQIQRDQHSYYYVLLLLVSLLAISPFIYLSDRINNTKTVILTMVVLSILSCFLLSQTQSFYSVLLGVGLFFAAFNLLETMLPSEVGRIAPAGLRGTFIGFFMTSQFLGFFFGGIIGGWVLMRSDISLLMLVNMLVCLAWFILILETPGSKNMGSRVVDLTGFSEKPAKEVLKELLSTRGVIDVVLIEEEQVAYLKVDQEQFDDSDLD